VNGLTISVDGRLIDPDQPAILATDHALLTGDGVFETLRVYEGTPFALTRHLDRLRSSADGLGLPPPSEDVLRSAVAEVLEASGLTEARLRITVTGGPAPLGSDRGPGGSTLIVAAGPISEWPASTKVVVVPWPRNERGAVAGLKTVSYAENVVALARAHSNGAGEAIFGNTAGHLCEGTGTNIFVGIDGRLLTPPLSSGCLGGITRELLVESGVAVEEDLPLEAIHDAPEAFLTSSTREVQPVSHVDDRPLPECPGPLTELARARFAEILADDLDP
jgi:branched-chain amino acid aminotransferase